MLGKLQILDLLLSQVSVFKWMEPLQIWLLIFKMNVSFNSCNHHMVSQARLAQKFCIIFSWTLII